MGPRPPSDPDTTETVTDGADGRRLVPKVYAVFNAAQVDGWTTPTPAPVTIAERDQRAESWIAATGAQITDGHDHACYRPTLDRIELPAIDQFEDPAAFYATACHELTHWTGHPARLARDLSGRFGDDAYAAEELVAELGAAISSAHLAMVSSPREDHAAYLAQWLRILNADPQALFTVASKAQAAVDHLATYRTAAASA